MTAQPPKTIEPQKPPPPPPKKPAGPAPDMLADMSAFDGDELDAPEGAGLDPDYIAGEK